jgi:methionyl aminopeptidase
MVTRNQILIKTAAEIEILTRGGSILATIINDLSCFLKSGMTTAQVDAAAENLSAQHQVRPAFKGYRGFPACACVSVNHEIVHGIPGPQVIEEGDIVSLDVGILHQGFYSDMAVTIGVGKISKELQKLLNVTRESLSLGIAQAKAGQHLSDISFAIQNFVEANHYSVVRDFVGHGIGKDLHEPPEIPNFGPPHCGPVLKEGMILAIEPMVNIGTWQTKIVANGWTVETQDGKPSAHFEHSVAVTADGPVILTV